MLSCLTDRSSFSSAIHFWLSSQIPPSYSGLSWIFSSLPLSHSMRCCNSTFIVTSTFSESLMLLSCLSRLRSLRMGKVDIQEDIKRYQNTPSYASSKVDCSLGENIYMLSGDMNPSIKSGTVGYNN